MKFTLKKLPIIFLLFLLIPFFGIHSENNSEMNTHIPLGNDYKTDQDMESISLDNTSSTVQLDFSDIFNADIVKTNNSDSNYAFDNDGGYITSSVADYWTTTPSDGLPDDGVFESTSKHPKIDFDWEKQYNSWKLSNNVSSGSAIADVQNGNYNEVHVFAATAQNGDLSADFQLGLMYADGTEQYSEVMTAEDWYVNDPPTNGYILINDLDRWNTGDYYDDVNEVAIFGWAISVDSTKELQSVKIDVIEKATWEGPHDARGGNFFAFFGGVASTEITESAPPMIDVISPSESTTYTHSNLNINVSVVDSSIDTVLAEIDYTKNITLSLVNGTYQGSYDFSGGNHDLRIIANDTDGYTTEAIVNNFVIDLDKPTITVDSPTTQIYTSSDIQIEVSASDQNSEIDTVLAEIDYTQNITMDFIEGSYRTAYSFGDGDHSIRIIANDTSGHTNSEEVNFTIDTVGPEITIEAPIATTYSDSIIDVRTVITDDNSEVDKVFTELNGLENFTMNKVDGKYITQFNLTDGVHSIRVIANDTSGNTNSKTLSFAIDTTGPQITIENPTSEIYFKSTIDISAFVTDEHSEIGIVLAELDGMENFTMNQVDGKYVTQFNLDDGEYTLRIIAQDSSLFYSSQSVTFTIDTSGPEITTDPVGDLILAQHEFRLNATVTSNSTIDTVLIEIENDQYVMEELSGIYTIQLFLAEGEYSIKISANDSYGNLGTTSFNLVIDTSSPTISLEESINEYYTNSILNFQLIANDKWTAIDSLLAEIDGTTNITIENINGLYILEYEFTEGDHLIRFIANDTLGHQFIQTAAFTVDTISPNVEIYSPQAIEYGENSINVSYYISQSSLVTIYINGTANSTAMESGYLMVELSPGVYNITITAIDTAGNVGSDVVIFWVTPEDIVSTPDDETEDTTNTNNTDTTETSIDLPENGWTVLGGLLALGGGITVLLRRRA